MSDTAHVDPLEKLAVGMTAMKEIVVTRELTVGHAVPGMPFVYGTPFMILLMEVAAGAAIAGHLPAGWVSVGTRVNIRHLAATPVGRTVRATAVVTALAPKSVDFSVEVHDGSRLIGDGTHRRGLVNVAAFEERFGVST